MEHLVEILKYLMPSVAAILIAYWFINRPIKLEKERHAAERSRLAGNAVTPIRIRAHERLMLFLDRTSPDQLVPRVMEQGMTALQLQMALLKSIREEFEHNSTQQLYVSDEVWQAVIGSKENLVQLINLSASQVRPDASAVGLAQIIIQVFSGASYTATDAAKEQLKQELQRLIEA